MKILRLPNMRSPYIYSFDGRPNITQIHISIIYFQKHAAEKQIATIQ